MTASQIYILDKDEAAVAVDSELAGGKQTPQQGSRDGAHATIGATADAAVTSPAAAGSLIGLMKGLLTLLSGWLTTRSYGFDETVTPVVTAGAYSAGDIVGGLLTFPVARANDEMVTITGAQVSVKSAITPALKLVLLSADPTATTKTDNAAWSLNAADAFKEIKTIEFGSLWNNHGTPKSIAFDNLGLVAKPAAGTKNVYGILVDGTGVSPGSTSDYQVRLRGIGC